MCCYNLLANSKSNVIFPEQFYGINRYFIICPYIWCEPCMHAIVSEVIYSVRIRIGFNFYYFLLDGYPKSFLFSWHRLVIHFPPAAMSCSWVGLTTWRSAMTSTPPSCTAQAVSNRLCIGV